jgi:ESS family glutamate:Na+ symporter
MGETTLVLSAPLYLAAGVFTLLLGDQLTRRISALRELCIPRPVTGGLLFAGLTWLLARARFFELELDGDLHGEVWSMVFAAIAPDKPLQIDQPFLIAFFTCVGLSCSAAAIREGGRSVTALLATASLLALLQAVLGVGVAVAWGHHPTVDRRPRGGSTRLLADTPRGTAPR